MPSVVVGGNTYELAGLRLSDVRALSKSGCLGKLARLTALEPWEQIEAAAEVVSTSARRAGAKVSAEDLLEAATAQELPAVILAVTEVMRASGFEQGGGGESPNGESPAPSTSSV